MELKERYGLRGEVEHKVWDKFGNLKIHRPFSPNQVQDAGLAVMADRILKDAPGSEDGVDYIATGTGTGQAVTDTTLATEVTDSGLERTAGTGTRVTTTTSNDTAQLVVSFSVTGTVSVTEVGMFNASSAGDMVAYQTQTALPLVSGDTYQITWKLVFYQA